MKDESFERLSRIACKFGIDLHFLFGSMKEKGLSMLRGEEVVLLDPLADLDVGVVFGRETFPERPYKVFGSLYYEMAEVFKILKEILLSLLNF